MNPENTITLYSYDGGIEPLQSEKRFFKVSKADDGIFLKLVVNAEWENEVRKFLDANGNWYSDNLKALHDWAAMPKAYVKGIKASELAQRLHLDGIKFVPHIGFEMLRIDGNFRKLADSICKAMGGELSWHITNPFYYITDYEDEMGILNEAEKSLRDYVHNFCPNPKCNEPWSLEEIEWQSCDRCSYPLDRDDDDDLLNSEEE